MDKNIIEQIVVPYNPPSANVVQRNQYNLFAPIGGINRVGMVGYSADDFVIIGGNILQLKVRPEKLASDIESLEQEMSQIQESLDTKLDKIEPDNNTVHVYGVGAAGSDDTFGNYDGVPYLRKASISTGRYLLVIRDENGELQVTSSPKKNSSAVSALYVSKQITPITKNLEEITRRINSIEYASTGNIYDNITLSGTAQSFQVDNACPYGVFTKLGCVKKLRRILPFNLSKSSNITSVGVNGFKPMVGKTAYIRCDVPKGKTVKVNAEGVNGTVVKRFSLSSLVGGSGFDDSAKYFNPNALVTATQDNKYIYVEKDGDESEYTNFQIVFSDNYVPSDTTTFISEIEVPGYIRGMSGYGTEGSYMDLVEKKLYTSKYAPQDIDIDGLDFVNIINFPLLPSMIVQFIGEDDSIINAQYEIVYKNKI